MEEVGRQPGGDPYDPPAASVRDAGSTGYTYRDHTGLSNALRGLLVIGIGIGLLMLYVKWTQLQMLCDIRDGLAVDRTNIETRFISSGAPLVLGTVLTLATAILGLMWVHRSCANAHALSPSPMRFSPAWAVGWYFVPILWWWKPYQVMHEIWQASRWRKPAQDDAQDDANGVVGGWWFLWLLGTAVGFAGAVVSARANGVEDQLVVTMVSMVRDGIRVATCITSLVLVTRILQMQWTSHRQSAVGLDEAGEGQEDLGARARR
jgi:hypothetical protein